MRLHKINTAILYPIVVLCFCTLLVTETENAVDVKVNNLCLLTGPVTVTETNKLVKKEKSVSLSSRFRKQDIQLFVNFGHQQV